MSPKRNTIPTKSAFISKKPVIGIIKYLISLKPNIKKDSTTHNIKNIEG